MKKFLVLILAITLVGCSPIKKISIDDPSLLGAVVIYKESYQPYTRQTAKGTLYVKLRDYSSRKVEDYGAYSAYHVGDTIKEIVKIYR